MARSRASTRPPTKRSSTARPSAPPNPGARADDGPIAAGEFEAALDALNLGPPFALAVSGGADSLALMLLTTDWAKRHKHPPPSAITVDHGLREGSSLEATRVADWARKHGVPHTTLTWSGRKPAQNIQALARDARYRLIAGHMREHSLAVLLTGHTRDDQAETFLLRLARGSGLEGLSGMAQVAPFPAPEFADLKIARPLLAFPHNRLVATLRARKQDWIKDPSNDNDRFARVQIRKLMPALAEAGVTGERIASAATHLARARDAIDAAAAALIDGVEISQWGYALVTPQHFAASPSEVALRALARLIEAVGGAQYPPRFEQTVAALVWLVSCKPSPRGRTLGGCRIACRIDGRVLVAREEAALAKEDPILHLKKGESGLWDRRYRVTLSIAPADARFEVRRLGVAGLKSAGAKVVLPPVEPHRIAACTPGLWRDGRLVAAPLLELHRDEAAFSARFAGVSRLAPG